MLGLKKQYLAGLVVVLAAVGAAYSNHFENDFHFDDSHAVQSNPYITTLANTFLFFTNGQTFSALPLNQSYRPLLTLSLAFDYWWGGGLKPVAFHVTTFVFYLMQLIVTFLLLRRVLGENKDWLALMGTAAYGLHPVSAESVNYIIQRGEVMSTLGVVAALWLFIEDPKPWGWHLAAMLFGCFSKQPAVMFAPILASYVWLYHVPKKKEPKNERLNKTIRLTWPAFAVGLAFYILQKKMTPSMSTTGGSDLESYVATQPWITLYYFRSFFWPNHLSADTDWGLLHKGDPELWIGVMFLATLVGFTIAAIRDREWRTEALGLVWFFVALLPTAGLGGAMAEVTNDHRMYFPYVGLTITVASLLGRGFALIPERMRIPAVAAFCLIVFPGAGYATHQRNEVWRTENTLWFDVTQKSPKNGRGLMNYGLTLMQKGDYAASLDYFERSHVILPNYTYVETNLGIVKGALKRDEEAEKHFKRAMTLSPVPVAHAYYARFLRERHRLDDARKVLELGLRMQPDHWDITFSLLQTLADLNDVAALKQVLGVAKKQFPYRTELNRFDQFLSRAP